MTLDVQVRRVQDEARQNDGTRVLVDRVWPRGVAKADARLDYWNKDVAPSTDLRKWFGHDPEKFDEFAERYRAELDTEAGEQALRRLREAVRRRRLTLLTATKDVEHSHATVLAQMLHGT